MMEMINKFVSYFSLWNIVDILKRGNFLFSKMGISGLMGMSNKCGFTL